MSARKIHEFRRIQVSLGAGQYVHVDIDVKWDQLSTEDRELIDGIVDLLFGLADHKGEPS